MRNVSRPRLAVPLALLVVVTAIVSGACSTFAGPAWQVGDTTMSVDQFSSDYDASLTETDLATTTSGRLPTAGIAAFMTNQIQQEILNQGLANLGLDISQEDLDQAELAMQQQAQQSGQTATPSDEDIANQAKIVKLGTKLVKDEVDAGTFDLDAAVRQVFEENAEQLSTPPQTCLHALFILVDQADPTATPTEAEKAAAQAEADAALARLATEDFGAVSADVSVLESQYPGGDLGCQPTEELNPDLAAIVDPLEPLELSAPTYLEGDNGYVILRVDSRTTEATEAKFEDFEQEVTAYVVQQRTSELVQVWLREQGRTAFVLVDARFGTWDAEKLQVVPPDGAATPTVPTTAITGLDPSTIGGLDPSTLGGVGPDTSDPASGGS